MSKQVIKIDDETVEVDGVRYTREEPTIQLWLNSNGCWVESTHHQTLDSLAKDTTHFTGARGLLDVGYDYYVKISHYDEARLLYRVKKQ